MSVSSWGKWWPSGTGLFAAESGVVEGFLRGVLSRECTASAIKVTIVDRWLSHRLRGQFLPNLAKVS